MAKKSPAGKTTVAELKAWLEAIEDIQGENWVPDATQWKKVRTKIQQLESVDIEEAIDKAIDKAVKSTRTSNQAPVYQQPIHTSGYAQVISGPSSLDIAPQTTMTTTNGQWMQAPGAEQTKTPDIDTSNGQYKSTFV